MQSMAPFVLCRRFLGAAPGPGQGRVSINLSLAANVCTIKELPWQILIHIYIVVGQLLSKEAFTSLLHYVL
jgi:hypothetical protein